jgi:hypothetical protein
MRRHEDPRPHQHERRRLGDDAERVALTADPDFVSGDSHGIREFLEGCERGCWRGSGRRRVT